MDKKWLSWFLFIILSVIWGSSFVLMKEGLKALSAYQVASVRIISSGLVLLPVALRWMHRFSFKTILIMFLSGTLGSLLPAYLFCIAEQEIDSSLAGVLNSLTPVFAIVIGVMFFNAMPAANKILGIAVAFAGTVLLFIIQPGPPGSHNLVYMLYIVLATVFYGINVNLVHKYLADAGSLRIAAIALFFNAIPAAVVLWGTGYFSQNFNNSSFILATGYSALLGVMGTAVASVLFYVLIKSAGAVFASMVTYGIPAVAIAWGIVYDEKMSPAELFCVAIILAGVWLANRKPASKITEVT